jgi:hypothetical protein
MKIGKIINLWQSSPHQGLSKARWGQGVFSHFVTDHT